MMVPVLADGPHFQGAEEVEVEEVRAVMEKNRQMGQDRLCSWSGRVGSEREGWAGGRGKVFGPV